MGLKSDRPFFNLKTNKKQNDNINYCPTKKHSDFGWGSPNPIKNLKEGNYLLKTGIKLGKQIYNVDKKGNIIKFQPDNTPNNGYHSYQVMKPRDIPSKILKEFYISGIFSKTQYNKIRKGKK